MGAEPDDAPALQRYRTSLVVAGCPYVQTMQDFGDVLADPMMRHILQPDILRGVRRAFV